MAKIPESLNIGDPSKLTTEDLLNIITDLYKEIAVNLNKKIEVYERDAGLPSDTLLAVGTVNINTDTQTVQMLVKKVPGTATWKTL